MWTVASSVSWKCCPIGMRCSDIITECTSSRFPLRRQRGSSCRLRAVYLVGHRGTASSCHYCCWRYALLVATDTLC